MYMYICIIVYIYIYIYISREWEELERGFHTVEDPTKVLGDPVLKEYYMFEQIKVTKKFR